MALVRQLNPASPGYLADEHVVLYFSGRPVAVRKWSSVSGATDWFYYVVDHLGAPILVADDAGLPLWYGGLEPFGADYGGSWEKAEVFLRLPGQWEEPTWESEGLVSGLFNNVHRWYSPGIGAYSRPDPAGLIRSNLDSYGYALRNPMRLVDPFGLSTCVVISANTLFELGDSLFAFGDHSALLIAGPCQPSESCSSPGPLLYDPAGGYSLKFPGSGSAQVLSQSVPGWSLGGFFDYHCDSGSDFLEIYCFNTTCCEENQIGDNLWPAGAFGCSSSVGGAVRGVGPFSDLGGTATPAILRRGMNRLLRKHAGAGAFTWTYTCPRSTD